MDFVNNTDLGVDTLGYLAWAYENSPFTENAFQVRFPLASDLKISELIETGYIDLVDGSDPTAYTCVILDAKNEVPAIFREFCRLYGRKTVDNPSPGAVGSIPDLWKRFKKIKGHRIILKHLQPSFLLQVEDRKRKKANGDFVPSWKNLSTWLNQRCWEIEIAPEEVSDADKNYRAWLTQKFSSKVPMIFNEEQRAAYSMGTGPFAGINKILTQERKLSMFEAVHREYYNGSLVEPYLTLINRYKAIQ